MYKFFIKLSFVLCTASASASADDMFSLHAGEHTLIIHWYMGLNTGDSKNLYNYETYWRLLETFAANHETLSKIEDRYSISVSLKNDIYYARGFADQGADFNFEAAAYTLENLLSQINSFIIIRYSLKKSTAKEIHIYKLLLPYTQKEEHSKYDDKLRQTWCYIGAKPGNLQSMSGRGLLAFYLDYQDLTEIIPLLSGYSFTIYSALVNRNSINAFLKDELKQ